MVVPLPGSEARYFRSRKRTEKTLRLSGVTSEYTQSFVTLSLHFGLNLSFVFGIFQDYTNIYIYSKTVSIISLLSDFVNFFTSQKWDCDSLFTAAAALARISQCARERCVCVLRIKITLIEQRGRNTMDAIQDRATLEKVCKSRPRSIIFL